MLLYTMNNQGKDFDSDTDLSSSDYVNLTGISMENFDELHTYIKEHIRNTPARSTKTSLGIFLFKMKAGISNKVISTIFNISRSSLTRAISSVRQALMQTFVSQNLGLRHIRNHTRPLLKHCSVILQNHKQL